MNLWTMIVMIVTICVIGDIFKTHIKKLNGSEKSYTEVSKLLDRLMRRVENLETIVIEKENTRRFEEIEKN